uniref:ATREV3 n=1 Tax=Arundo donax TaxID=35708 RepID=A0A0A9EWR7_ARUDO
MEAYVQTSSVYIFHHKAFLSLKYHLWNHEIMPQNSQSHSLYPRCMLQHQNYQTPTAEAEKISSFSSSPSQNDRLNHVHLQN